MSYVEFKVLFSSNSIAGVKKKSGSFTERANIALSSLQRNAYAMNLLRSRLEFKINQALSNPRGIEESQQLVKMLELVKGGETMLEEMSSKVESAKFLEEFIVILDSAANSVREITGDMEKMVPAAELALQELHNTILKTSMSSTPEQESENKCILDEATSASKSLSSLSSLAESESTLPNADMSVPKQKVYPQSVEKIRHGSENEEQLGEPLPA